MSNCETGRGRAALGNTRPRVLLAGVLSAALLAFSAVPATAQTWTGTTSNDWTVGANWSTSVVPAGGTVVINTTSPNSTVLGVSGPAVGTTGQLIIGNLGGSTGDLTIQNGSTLTSATVIAPSTRL